MTVEVGGLNGVDGVEMDAWTAAVSPVALLAVR
jgi:hypothetical protein